MTLASRPEAVVSLLDLASVLSSVSTLLASADGGIRLRELTEEAVEALGFDTFTLCSLEHTTLVYEASSRNGSPIDWRTLDAIRTVSRDAPPDLKPMVLAASASGDADAARIAAMGLSSVVVVPLVTSGRCVGALTVGAVHRANADPAVLAALQMLAAALGAVIDRRRRALMTDTGDAVFLHGHDGIVIDVNDEAIAALGLPRSAIIGRVPAQFDAHVPEESMPAIGDALDRRGSVEMETMHQDATGREYPVELRLRRLQFGDRQYTVSVARDITRRKEAEEALRRSQALLKLAHDIGAFGSYELDPQTGRVLLSDNLRPMFGLPAGSGEVALEALLDRPHLRELVLRLRDTPIVVTGPDGGSDEIELRGRTETGAPRIVQVRRRAIVDATGAKIRVVGTVQDISERRLAEEALARSEAMMQRAQRMAQIGSWVCDLDTKTVTISPEGARLRGLTGEVFPAEVLLERMQPDDREHMRPMMEATLRGIPFEAEYRLLLPGHKQPRYIRTLVEPERDDSGRVVRLVGITQDITARHELESQLRHAQKQEIIGRLAGGVAHDFNNLLTIINGLGESLARQMADRPAVVEDLRAILEAGRRAATLTRQLLAVSRRQQMELTVLDLNTVVVEAESLLRRTISAHVAITHQLAPNLPPVRVDRGQLEQVIMNLVLNARDAMPDGGVITLTTGVREVAAGAIADVGAGTFVVLDVSDTGVGMPEDTLSRVFEPFFTTKPLGQGTGLGLAMVQGIVSQSGGYVQAESQPGRGTTVHIGLPATDELITGADSVAVEPETAGTGTVLLVEDEDGVRRLTQRVLESNGYTVILADSGEAAMALPASVLESADLLLTDIMMPGMTGAELAIALRRHHPDLPVIFMSGYASDALDVEHVPGLFLQKPFRIDDLSASVRTALRRD